MLHHSLRRFVLLPSLTLALSALSLPVPAVFADTEPSGDVAILPPQLVLHGPESRHALLVQRMRDGEYAEQLTEIEFRSSNPDVALVVDGVVRPRANGKTVIHVEIDGKSAEAEVEVTGIGDPHAWSFRHHVQPILAKAGCNSGACHGALAGKGGFKLSLRGYDPKSDHHTITRQARGRRIELGDPGRSLLLAKPSGAIPHKGGLRFEIDSMEYRVLSEWISKGAAAPADDDPKLAKLEVLPALTMLRPGREQQIMVRAHYDNGRVEDVTRWAIFASTNEVVAKIDAHGKVSVIGNGEGAVTAWFSSKIAIARITSPYPHQIAPAVYADAPRRNFIDELVMEKLQRLNLAPSPPATDHEFLRRVYLDCIGVLPTQEETLSFLEDASPDKRDKLIDDLLQRPEFVDYWTYKWSDVLMLNGTLLRPDAIKAYYHWIRGHVENNTPWDKFVHDVLTAQGDSVENGATNFYALHQDPENMTENACQAFLGLSIGCAKCHNHPLEKWTNDQYYAMANLFARVRAKGWGGDPRNGDGHRTLYVASRGDVIQPLTGKPQPPTPLDGDPLPLDATEDRRIHLANWMTSPRNPYFSRAITNRIWANYFGVGLVESVDDMRMSNPASNDQLLNAAADHLVRHQFDLKSLMRVIMRSAAYQRSSLPLPTNGDEQQFYSRYYPRRLMAEALLDAISQVTDSPTVFDEIEFPGADRRKTEFYPLGTRALQLYDSAVSSYFLKTFGRNQRRITCECERSDEPSMVQVLHMANGDTVNGKLQAKDNRISKLLEAKLSNAEIIDRAYLVSLCRRPEPAEREPLLKILAETDEKQRRVAIEDLFWSILSSREFVFNH